MKNLLIILLAFGGLLNSLDAQTLQKYQRPKIRCITNATINYPTSVPEGWNFDVTVIPQSYSAVKYVSLYIDQKYIGRKTSPYYHWNLNTTQLSLTPGKHKIKVILMSKCGNSKQFIKYFYVNKFR